MYGAAQLDTVPPEKAQAIPISPQRARTVQDLLDHLSEGRSTLPNLLNMLKTTTAHISRSLNRPLNEIQINQLSGALPQFITFLTESERRFKRNSIRSYQNYFRKLLQIARDLVGLE